MGELYFFYGTLCHARLRRAVLGRDVATRPAWAAGHEVRQALDPGAEDGGEEDCRFPLLVAAKGGAAEGVLAEIAPDEAARLDFYETGFHPAPLTVTDADGRQLQARAYLPQPGCWETGRPWDLPGWVARWGEIATLAADEFLALRGQVPPEQALARYGNILVRAASRLRAARPRPAQLRHAAQPGDVVVEDLATPYAKFFAVEDYRLRHRLFRGGQSAALSRAAFVSGDATVVLPYDPRRDVVLLVEQFRAGPLARGDANPWSLETVAGRVDAGETPEAAARREAAEEAGVTLGRLIAAPSFYPSPGAKSEYLYCFIGLADLPEGAAGFGGLEEEGEDIRSHRLGFAQMMALIASGEIENGPLIVLALWLQGLRAGLRAEADPEADNTAAADTAR